MGVVRREGDWRLEKRDEGVYEVTYRKSVEMKVLTPDYQPGVTEITGVDVVPVREASAYAEVEELFEERAQAGPPDDVGTPSSGTGGSPSADRAGSTGSGRPPPAPSGRTASSASGRTVSTGSRVSPSTGSTLGLGTGSDGGAFGRLPPGGFALVALLVGAVFVLSAGSLLGSAGLLFGALLSLGGLAVFGWAAVLYRTRGPGAARAFLTREERAADGEWTLDRG